MGPVRIKGQALSQGLKQASNPSAKRLGQKSFADVMKTQATEAPRVKPQAVSSEAVKTGVVSFMKEWQQTERGFAQKIRKLAPEHRSFLELQLSVNKLHLRTELVTKAAENLSGTMKRLQQAGNG